VQYFLLKCFVFKKVLKDIYLRYKLLAGFKIDYKPGWDCHGLPIELNALKKSIKDNKKRKNVDVTSTNIIQQNDPISVRMNARQYAYSQIETQMNSFKKMNLLADWTNIYRTFDVDYMCSQIDLFYSLFKDGLIYRSFMPVYWSPSSRTALAESELEYNAKHQNVAVYVAYQLTQSSIFEKIKTILKPNQKVLVPIWTTTIWSLPCNKAIAYNSNLKYNLVKVEDDFYIVSTDALSRLRETIPSFKDAFQIDDIIIEGQELKGSFYKSKLNDQVLPLISSDHVTSSQGTGLVHIGKQNLILFLFN
jgi:isoleucyl-tRNA synthetase